MFLLSKGELGTSGDEVALNDGSF